MITTMITAIFSGIAALGAVFAVWMFFRDRLRMIFRIDLGVARIDANEKAIPGQFLDVTVTNQLRMIVELDAYGIKHSDGLHENLTEDILDIPLKHGESWTVAMDIERFKFDKKNVTHVWVADKRGKNYYGRIPAYVKNMIRAS